MKKFNPVKVLLVYEPGEELERMKLLIGSCFKGRDVFIKPVPLENLEAEKGYSRAPDFIVAVLEDFLGTTSGISVVFPEAVLLDGRQKLTANSFKKQ